MREEAVLELLGNPYARLSQPDARIHRLIERGRPFSAFSRVWKELGLDRETVALILGISDRTLHRREHQDKRLSQPEADRAFRLARLFALAREVFGDNDKARGWMRTANPSLGDRPPVTLLSDDYGAEKVEELLLQIHHGVLH